jgi:hypothetical protein
LARDGKVWTDDREFAAVAIERQDMWWAWLASALGARPGQFPPLVTFRHPDRKDPEPERPQVRVGEMDRIARFFGRSRK